MLSSSFFQSWLLYYYWLLLLVFCFFGWVLGRPLCTSFVPGVALYSLYYKDPCPLDCRFSGRIFFRGAKNDVTFLGKECHVDLLQSATTYVGRLFRPPQRTMAGEDQERYKDKQCNRRRRLPSLALFSVVFGFD